MDGQKFDKLARAFAAGTDRRTLLKLIGGGSLVAAAGVALPRTQGAFAQGTAGPGDACEVDSDCYVGLCSDSGVCYCEDPSRPEIGCPCQTGTQDPCYGSTAVCCANDVNASAGADGTCVSDSVGCDPTGPTCSAPQTSCESTGCCTEGECGANGWCYGCYSGTEDPCGPLNEAYGASYICCTASGAAAGSLGYCTEESLCVVSPPNTGAGTTSGGSNWIAPVAAVGAAAAVLGWKNREKSENEA